jgi:hypothetical protein
VGQQVFYKYHLPPVLNVGDQSIRVTLDVEDGKRIDEIRMGIHLSDID